MKTPVATPEPLLSEILGQEPSFRELLGRLERRLDKMENPLDIEYVRNFDNRLDELQAGAEFFSQALVAQAQRIQTLESRPGQNPALLRHFERVAEAVAQQDPGHFTAVVERLLGL